MAQPVGQVFTLPTHCGACGALLQGGATVVAFLVREAQKP